MILIPIRFEFDTRKLQKYIKGNIPIFDPLKVRFHAILSEIWEDGSYYTNLEYKPIIRV